MTEVKPTSGPDAFGWMTAEERSRMTKRVLWKFDSYILPPLALVRPLPYLSHLLALTFHAVDADDNPRFGYVVAVNLAMVGELH